MAYTQADTCPGCGRHPRPNEPLPQWIMHIAACTAAEAEPEPEGDVIIEQLTGKVIPPS